MTNTPAISGQSLQSQTLRPHTVPNGQFLVATNLAEALQISDVLAQSSFVPKMYQGHPNNVLVAMHLGAEVGLAPLQALQSICVINAQPSLWGDAMIALVQSSVLCESFEEGFDVESQTGWAKTKRRGRQPAEQLFTMQMAQKAGLTSKQGPWKSYPERMCKLKARNWLCRDVYPDVLKGLSKLNIIEQDLVQLDNKMSHRDEHQSPVDPDIQKLQRPPSSVFIRNRRQPPATERIESEVIDATHDTVADPVPDEIEEYQLVVKGIVAAIGEADSDAQLKAIKKDITDLPEAVVQQSSLVDIWNTRKAQLKQAS